MGFVFSERSKKNLHRVHPALVSIATRALELSEVDFVVTEGLRSLEVQKKYLAEGKSRTLRSYHLAQKDGYSHAIDVAAIVDGKVTWDLPPYRAIADAFKQAAKEQGGRITWGGDWKKFVDSPHFQLEL